MAKELSPQEAIERAQRALDDRLTSVRELAESRQKLADVREASAARIAEIEREEREKVAAAERDDARAYSATIDAGWTPAQRDQYYNVLRRYDGADAPDLQPLPNPPIRNVRKIDKAFIGAAPGLDDGADHSVKVQLPLLGETR